MPHEVFNRWAKHCAATGQFVDFEEWTRQDRSDQDIQEIVRYGKEIEAADQMMSVLYAIHRQSDGRYYRGDPKVRYGRVQRKEFQPIERAKLYWTRKDAQIERAKLCQRGDDETYTLIPLTLVEIRGVR